MTKHDSPLENGMCERDEEMWLSLLKNREGLRML